MGMPRNNIVGHKCEIEVFDELKQLPDPWAMACNVLLPAWYRNNSPDETDVILVGPSGIYSLEVKCWYGKISGYFNDAYVDRVTRNGFPPEAWPNPIKTANDKKNILYSTLRDNLYRGKMRAPVIGGVIFASRDECSVDIQKRFDINMPLLHHKELVRHFKAQITSSNNNVDGRRPYRLDEQEIDRIFEFIHGQQNKINPVDVTAGSYVLTMPIKYRSTNFYEAFLGYNKFLPSQKALIKKLNIDQFLPENEYKEAHDRLLREARALDEMRGHPNMIQVQNVFLHAGETYVAYEWIDGPSLADIIDSEDGYDPKELLKSVMLPVLDGIRVAHEKKIMHRSLSSNSIVLPTEGDVKIADFGMARGFDSPNINSPLKTKLQETPYTASESLTSKYNQTIDIYALGAICYEIVTGYAPPTPSERIRKGATLLFDKSRNDPVNVPLQKWISQAMDLAPGRRFSSVSEMMESLRVVLL